MEEVRIEGVPTAIPPSQRDQNFVRSQSAVWKDGLEYILTENLVAGHITVEPRLTTCATQWYVENGPPGCEIISSVQSAYITYTDHGRNARSQTVQWSGAGGTGQFNFGDDLVGGQLFCTATVTWRDPRDGTIKQTAQRTLPWSIVGDNPSKDDIKNQLPELQLQVICYIESRFRQFGSDGNPMFGPPRGFGVMQLDTPPPPDAQLFNWRLNLASGVALYRKKKSEVDQHFRNIMSANPGAPPLTSAQVKMALYQYYNGGFYYNWDVGTKSWVQSGVTSYADSAIAIENAVVAGTPPPDWN